MPTSTPPHSIYDVFTPGTNAKVNFVERPDLENDITNALQTPGKQLIVYGQSGSGKSSLIYHKLHQLYPNHVTVRCTQDTTYEQVLLEAFDQLNLYYTTSATASNSQGKSASVQASYAFIRATIDSRISSGNSETAERLVPPQLTAQRLAQMLGEQDLCLVLEDFHKVSGGAKGKLAQALKVFVDESSAYPTVKVIAIGATDSPREILDYDPELANRVSEVHVPLMDDEELGQILTQGQKILNIILPSKVISGIIDYSSGLGAVCHQIALNVCRAAEITHAAHDTVTVSEDSLSEAVREYVRESSDSLKKRYDKAIRRYREVKYDNGRLILTALSSMPDEGATHAQLIELIHKDSPEYPASNLSNYLNELQTSKRGTFVRFDPASGRYSFSDPLLAVYTRMQLKPEKNTQAVDDSIEADEIVERVQYYLNLYAAKTTK